MRIRRITLGAALLAVVAATAVLAAGAFVPGGAQQAKADGAVVLTLTVGGNATEFTMDELEALPVYEGYSGMKNSAGTVFPPVPVKGVKLTDLLAEAGGMTTLSACDITASDNYGMTYTYDQVVNGNGIQMYNATTKAKEAPKVPWSLVLIYEQDGAPIAPAPGGPGPLRLVAAQETDVNQVADGHLLVKWVSRVTLRGAVKEWKVRMYGLKKKNRPRQTTTLDRTSFDSCAAPFCHGSSWTSSAKKMWSGVPLFLLIGQVDGGPSHDSYKAYNELLAIRGYRIKLVSATGKTAIITSRTARHRTRIILANKVMGSELTTRYYPLRLVGPTKYVPSRKTIGRITKIVLLPK